MSRATPHLTLETCILRVLAVQEAQKFARPRACSTSMAAVRGPLSRGLKRASIS